MRSVAATTCLTIAAVVAVLGPSTAAGARPVLTRATPDSVQSMPALRAMAAPTTSQPATGTVMRAATPVTLPPDGSFVTAANRVWRLVGRALVYVSSWAPYGGRHPTMRLTTRQYDAVRNTHVRDGEFIRTIQDGRVYVVADGTPIYVSRWAAVGGVHRFVSIDVRNLLHAGGADPWRAFNRCARLDENSRDPDHRNGPDAFISHFVRTLDGRVYVLTAGAPVYVSSWTPFGGPQRTVIIDVAAIARAGQAGPWRFLRWYPENSNTWGVLAAVSRPGATPTLFAVSGGAPIYVPDTRNFSDFYATYPVDPAAIARAGSGGPFNHLRFRPAQGAFIDAMHDADPASLSYPVTTFWISGGAAIPVVDRAACKLTWADVTLIDKIAVDKAGTGGVWDHLAQAPDPAPTPPC